MLDGVRVPLEGARQPLDVLGEIGAGELNICVSSGKHGSLDLLRLRAELLLTERVGEGESFARFKLVKRLLVDDKALVVGETLEVLVPVHLAIFLPSLERALLGRVDGTTNTAGVRSRVDAVGIVVEPVLDALMSSC